MNGSASVPSLARIVVHGDAAALPGEDLAGQGGVAEQLEAAAEPRRPGDEERVAARADDVLGIPIGS